MKNTEGNSMNDMNKHNDDEEFQAQIQKVNFLIQSQNYDEALKVCLNLEIKYSFMPELLFLFARIYKNLNQIDLAIKYYKKVLSINPDHPDTLNNLGNIYNATGNYNTAISLFQKVILLLPNAPQPYSNISQTYILLDDYDLAIKYAQKSIELNPSFLDAYHNLIKAQINSDLFEDALYTVTRALDVEVNNNDTLILFSQVLEGTLFTKYDLTLDKKIDILFDKNISGKFLASLTVRLEKHHDIEFLLSQLDNENYFKDISNIINKLNNVPNFLRIISSGYNTSLKIEFLLTKLRKEVLQNLNLYKNDENVITFHKALTIQCFYNEFIFFNTDKENKIVMALEKELEICAENNQLLSSLSLLSLGSYKKISNYNWARSISCCENIQDVFKLIISEPLLEKSIKPLLNQITEIKEEVSQLIEKQYSENPYPRWSYLPLNKETTVEQFVVINKLKLINGVNSLQSPPEILIAGCGTGRQSIHVAQSFPRSNIVAIDLSKDSLAYALRKTKELGINNINYAHGDILELSHVDKKYDLIECSGVLHHMNNPLIGLECLTKLLKENGLMKLGLYSQIARQDINKLRTFIKDEKIIFSENKARSFRQDIIKSKKRNYDTFSRDFYSLSSFRDLYFNLKEHQYTIPNIKTILDKFGLHFCGFVFSNDLIKKKFKDLFPQLNSEYSLDNWHQFELKNRRTFLNMYQFWVQKN